MVILKPHPHIRCGLTLRTKCNIVNYALQAYRIFNTYMGDHIRLVVLESSVREIQKQGLVAQAQKTGEVMLEGLREATVSRRG